MAAILLALGSLACSAVNDLVFKLYACKSRPVGIYMAIIGLIWGAVFLSIEGTAKLFQMNSRTVICGLLSGLFSAMANIFLIKSMEKHEVGICSTIYRLNLVPAAILAFLFLGENASMARIIGIAAAVGAVLLFFQSNGLERRISSGMWLIVLACVLRAGMGISYKWGLMGGGEAYQILFINGPIWTICGLAYGFIAERRTTGLDRKILLYGAFSGGLVSGIVLFMMLALKIGDASGILPITQLSFIVTGILGMILLREAITLRKIAAMLLAVICITFMLVTI